MNNILFVSVKKVTNFSSFLTRLNDSSKSTFLALCKSKFSIV